MLGLIDVSEYEQIIREEGSRRFNNNQKSGIEGMTNKTRARVQHLIGVAGEVAARLHYDLDPYEVSRDEIGAADFTYGGTKWDVKVIKADYRILNIQFYEGIFERKSGWNIQVVAYEGIGWRFMVDRVIHFRDLKAVPLAEPTGGHRSRHWSLDLTNPNAEGLYARQ